MSDQKTHREVKNPQISSRYLADYMAASETAKRTVVRNCKYQAIARVIQHDEAKMAISKFIRNKFTDKDTLFASAQKLRDRLADSAFDRDLLDHNADYIERFAAIHHNPSLPEAEYLPPGPQIQINMNGVKVTAEFHVRFRRLTKTNKVRIGAAMLRYAKGKELPEAVANWQSSFLFGCLSQTEMEAAEPEHKLCLTIDAYSGKAYSAPTDSVRRFQNMEAACASIAERWPNIAPPKGAVL